MSELAALSLVLIAVFAGLIKDAKTHRRVQNSSGDYSQHRSSDSLMMFAPFVAFFYTENFWLVVAGLFTICLAGMAAQSMLWRKGFLSSGAEMMLYTLPGLVMIILLIYWLVVLDGMALSDLLDQGNKAPTTSSAASDHAQNQWLVWWPYMAYAAIIIANLVSQRSKEGGVLAAAAIGFLVLPFFSDYFWLCLGLGFIGFFWLLLRRAKHWGSGAGAASAFFFMYMLATGGAAMLRLGLQFFGLV